MSYDQCCFDLFDIGYHNQIVRPLLGRDANEDSNTNNDDINTL